jgi:hypothetical protein
MEYSVARPWLLGGTFLAIGGWMTVDGIRRGAEYARYQGGTEVTGVVAELRGSHSIPKGFEMTVTWTDAGGTLRSDTVALYGREFDSLRWGDEVELLVARDDPSSAMVAGHHADQPPTTVLGISTMPSTFAGIGVLVFAIWLTAWGLRHPHEEVADSDE